MRFVPLAIFVCIAVCTPAGAQSIVDRLERLLGPPAGQEASQRTRPRARTSPEPAALPPADELPVPTARPADENEPEPAVEPEGAAPEVEEPAAPEPRLEDELTANDPDADEDAGEEIVPDDAEAVEEVEEEPSPAYVSPERARTRPEPSAPDTPEAGATPEESTAAAAALEDAEACEAELSARGVAFTVEPTISDEACGVLRPIALTRTSSGIAIEPATQMLCRTALALDIWVAEGFAPAAANLVPEDRPTAIRHVSTYVCRDRASESGISEHARGSAIDIGAIEWEEREPVSIEAHPPGSAEDKLLAAMRRAACGPFKTVLGPGSDADHANHFHFDIAARRGGSTYCR